jgi:hypothetical protein
MFFLAQKCCLDCSAQRKNVVKTDSDDSEQLLQFMKPILRDIPDQIETQRLVIRCPRPGDGRAAYEAVASHKTDTIVWRNPDVLALYRSWSVHRILSFQII